MGLNSNMAQKRIFLHCTAKRITYSESPSKSSENTYENMYENITSR
jgi:hypothetical protein